MKHFLALSFIAMILVSCGEQFETVFTSSLYFPAVSKQIQVRTSPKKGLVLGGASAKAAESIGASWYIGSSGVPYLDAPQLLESAPQKEPPESEYIMFLNECDRGGCGPIEKQVSDYIAAKKSWGGNWVGPCISDAPGSIDWLVDWWKEHYAQTDSSPDALLCAHCYNDCINVLSRVLEAGDELGIYRMWVGEFGYPLGTQSSLEQTKDKNQQLVDWMESEDRITRYAYWTGRIINYGDNVPCRPYEGWIGLFYTYVYADGRKEERTTFMGDWYAGVGR